MQHRLNPDISCLSGAVAARRRDEAVVTTPQSGASRKLTSLWLVEGNKADMGRKDTRRVKI